MADSFPFYDYRGEIVYMSGMPFERVEKIRVEARLLHWLSSTSKLPVPRLLSPISSATDEQDKDFFFITDKLPGTMLLHCFGLLEILSRERAVQSFVEFLLGLFGLKVPQKIDTLVAGVLAEPFDDVKPLVTANFRPATKAFDNIHEYFDFLLDAKKESTSDTTVGMVD
ncbi:hypothetical protein H0H87_006911 [Tephrocybe sp. NHM501043]|nr:hypothetical protein H0H87_006911 [Tephrocybe sp. NHM501043]